MIHTDEQDLPGPLHTVKSFADSEPAFTEGGIRWFIHQHRDHLKEKKAIIYFGRKIIIVGNTFKSLIMEGVSDEARK